MEVNHGDFVIISLVLTSGFIVFYIIYSLMRESKQLFQQKESLMEKLEKQIRKHMKEKDSLIKTHKQQKEALSQKHEKLKDTHHKLEIEILQMKQSLEKIQLEYLYATKKLSARGALELFQKRYVFKNKSKTQSAREMWKAFLQEDMGKEFQTKMTEAKCNNVPEIAARAYGAISEDIHNYINEGIRKVYLVKSELSHYDYIFLQNVCLALPLSPSDIVTLEHKSQFLFSPPRKS